MSEIPTAVGPTYRQAVLAAIGSQLRLYFEADIDSDAVPPNLSGLLKRLHSEEKRCR
jgi:hypothetical protein